MFHPRGPTFAELVRQALSSTRRGYDLLAPKFDWTPFRTPVVILSGLQRYLAENASGFRLQDVLDLCCGTGAVLEVLRPFCRRRAIGLDFSRGMLEVARGQLSIRGVDISKTPVHLEPPVHFVQADALAPPFVRAFDLVTCFSALGHIPVSEQEEFVAAVHGCLRPGGRFLFATAESPGYWSKSYWVSTGFNAAMHVRNWLWSPPFIMFYLTFLVPDAAVLLDEAGFDVELKRGVFPAPFEEFLLVSARRR